MSEPAKNFDPFEAGQKRRTAVNKLANDILDEILAAHSQENLEILRLAVAKIDSFLSGRIQKNIAKEANGTVSSLSQLLAR